MQIPIINGDEYMNIVDSVLISEGCHARGKGSVQISNADPGRVWVRAHKSVFIRVGAILDSQEGWKVFQHDQATTPEAAMYLVTLPKVEPAQTWGSRA